MSDRLASDTTEGTRDFLLELRCEEIPARMQAGARADLERLFCAELGEAGVTVGDVTVYSTPRRLALIARGLPEATEAVSEEAKGPPEGAPDQAIDGFCRKNGVTREQLELREVKGRNTWFAVIEKPGRAVRDVLAERLPLIVWRFPWPKSMRWGAASISTESLRWVRPLSGIVAILGEEPLEIDFDMAHLYASSEGDLAITKGVSGVVSGCQTVGHRFHHPGPITIGGARDYVDKLRACHVIVDHEERQDLIREKAAEAAKAAKLDLVEDEGLVIENAGLTEWPVPLLGRFDEDFLDVPPEVIQLTARVNQKYFVCEKGGKLADAFVCTANIEAADGGEAIVAGNRKVLAARLSDARFFWEQDRRKTLAEHAQGLERITFHEKLGTVADKVERVAKLARWLVEEGIVGSSLPRSGGEGDRDTAGVGGEGQGTASTPPSDADASATSPSELGEDRARLADLAEQAARLCKADLTTEMVGEFPELQGIMGGYYARAEGLPDAVADAIRDHYKPVGQGDEVPTAPVTVAVSLADKIDTLTNFFWIDERPTGSKDPFALRRAAIAIVALLLTNGLRLDLKTLVMRGIRARIEEPLELKLLESKPLDRNAILNAPEHPAWKETSDRLLDVQPAVAAFLIDRLKVQQREAGVRHDLIDAVFALGGEDDLVRLLARVKALQEFVGTDDGANLLTAYKRAANILKKEGYESNSVTPAKAGVSGESAETPEMPASAGMTKDLSYTPQPDEKALIDALDAAGPQAAAAVEAEDFGSAMAALASLRAPIDAVFDNVTVNDPDEEKRAARLSLLDRFRVAVHNVADFSKIEG